MADTLAHHPVFARWTLRHPERLQLFTAPTPNGVKVSILLEELGRPYEAHRVDIGHGDTATPEFRALNPNGKLPAIQWTMFQMSAVGPVFGQVG